MIIIASTDDKYRGREIDPVVVGKMVTLDDFQFEVVYVRHLENNHVAIGNSNYQIECEE